MDSSPVAHTLASLLTMYVKGKRTVCSIDLAVTFHGLTRNKELINILHKSGIGINYADVLLLHDFWAANDLQLSPLCPLEIADDVPAVVIVDNDDLN